MIQTFSNWCFNRESTFEDIKKIIEENKCEPIQNKPGKGFYNIKDENIEVDGECVRVLKGKVFVYNPKRGYENLPVHLQMNEYISDFIIYKDHDKFKLLLLICKTKAKIIISKIFSVFKDIEIMEDNQIDKDLLYWIVYRLRELQDEALIPNEALYLKGLVRYMGTSSDRINVVSGQGLRVFALMGTLAFIFNNENLKALRPRIQYKSTEITVEFNSNNTNRIELDDVNEDDITQYILVSKVILPKLLYAYNLAKDKGFWSPQIKLVFLRGIGNEINDKVQEQLKKIQGNIEKFKENEEDDEEESEGLECEQTMFEMEFDVDCEEENV